MQGVRVVQAAGHDAQVIQRSCCGAQAWRSICSGVGVCMMVVMMMMMMMMIMMMMITTSMMMMLTMVNRARRKSAKKRRAHGQRARAHARVKNANLQGEVALVQGMPCRSGAQTLQRGGSELVRCVRVMCDTALQAPPVCVCVCVPLTIAPPLMPLLPPSTHTRARSTQQRRLRCSCQHGIGCTKRFQTCRQWAALKRVGKHEACRLNG